MSFWYHAGWGAGWWVLGSVMAVAFWVFVALVVVRLFRGSHHHHHDWHGWHGSSTALQVLEERYARGEITREEFLERRSVLAGGPPPPPPPPS